MKSTRLRLVLLGVGLCLALALVALIVTAPPHPVALLRVVDANGKPIAGATVIPEGLRTKDGPYRSGWYGWRSEANHVTNAPVVTDEEGYAQVTYPKFVFERIETGVLCLSVNHPDFVPDRPERVVATALPAGAPLTAKVKHLWERVLHKKLLSRPEPIVLHAGAMLKISVTDKGDAPSNAVLFAQASGASDSVTWVRPEPNVIIAPRLAAGTQLVRAVMLDSNRCAWFSDVVSTTAVAGQTNELALALKRGVAVHGRLDDAVPRPVRNGRVVVNVWPQGAKPKENPPRWHAWTAVKEDGTFVINSLPHGELEIVAMCDGFVSTNGPGRFRTRYPQQHSLGSNDLHLVMGMETTARLEVHVTDGRGKALPGARVVTWPNVRYGEWASTILMSDCYNSADFLLGKLDRKSFRRSVLDFEGTSDTNGLAVLPNLPPEVTQLSVEHPQFVLPIVRTSNNQDHRRASFTLVAGKTNRISVQLEPKDSSSISHY
ncbi:MAG TPA: Ig-like domain-containing protein [Verrucomicrobiae bacterium]|nr:Ig-like domain-containing protein [Verrucomicrobiae bacterium]